MTEMLDSAVSSSGEVDRLRALLADSEASVPLDWRLTQAEESIFRALLARDVVSVGIISEVASAASPQAARTHLHRIRTKLTTAGVEIETLHGRGWRLVGREHWARVLRKPVNEGVQ